MTEDLEAGNYPSRLLDGSCSAFLPAKEENPVHAKKTHEETSPAWKTILIRQTTRGAPTTSAALCMEGDKKELRDVAHPQCQVSRA